MKELIEMTRKVKPKIKQGDKILEKVASVTQGINEKVEKSEQHALFVLAVSVPEQDQITTFTCATGFYELISRGLHAELSDQLRNGQTELFRAIQMVIRDLEKEHCLKDDVKLH